MAFFFGSKEGYGKSDKLAQVKSKSELYGLKIIS